MARDWEEQFRKRAKPPGKTEQNRCDNAVSAIRNAIEASDKLRAHVKWLRMASKLETSVVFSSSVLFGMSPMIISNITRIPMT